LDLILTFSFKLAGSFTDLWQLSGTSPSSRRGYSLSKPSASAPAIIWRKINDEYDLNPPARQGSGLAYANDNIFVFGGSIPLFEIKDNMEDSFLCSGQCFLNDFYQFSIPTQMWINLSDIPFAPSKRRNFGFASCLGKLFVFGGFYNFGGDLGYLNDIHMFDPESLEWLDFSEKLSGKIPQIRENPGFVSSGDKMYLFGGYNDISGVFMLCLHVNSKFDIFKLTLQVI
jgi:hypothetical protein